MKIREKQKTEVAMCFIDDEPLGYLRANPHGNPIWYKSTQDGFALIRDSILYFNLEKAYNEQEQQANKEEILAGNGHTAALEGAERPK
jgi:hypothetical protein